MQFYFTRKFHQKSVKNFNCIFPSTAVRDVVNELGDDCKLMKLCGADQPQQEEVQEDKFIMLDELLRNSIAIPMDGLPPPNYSDKLMYIYTSGTTGFPKAAVLLNSR